MCIIVRVEASMILLAMTKYVGWVDQLQPQVVNLWQTDECYIKSDWLR